MPKALITSIVTRMPSFIALPEASQCIYFHALADTDNAGIVNIKTILDITHIKATYVAPLVNARYIELLDYEWLAFVSHWRLHNINYDARFLKNPSPFLQILAEKIPDAPIYIGKAIIKTNKKGIEYETYQRLDATASEAFRYYFPSLASKEANCCNEKEYLNIEKNKQIAEALKAHLKSKENK